MRSKNKEIRQNTVAVGNSEGVSSLAGTGSGAGADLCKPKKKKKFLCPDVPIASMTMAALCD
jgi:hypothetical protein